jgi:endo-1,4-beta-xylanase
MLGEMAISYTQDDPGLQALAKRREFYVGAAVAMEPFKKEKDYQETLKREFNILVAENAFKFDAVHPAKGSYNFADTDALVSFAEANGMKLRGHTLVWHSQLPSWLTEGSFSRDEAIAILKDHIATVVGRYRGKVWAWDVVNEAVAEKGGALRTDSFWRRKIGPDYIRLAFQFAHEADPAAILYYNDFSAEDMGDKSKGVYNLLRDLKQRGVPVHGVGWQMHVESGFKTKPDHSKNAQRLAELGLELTITELDVRMKLPATPEALAKQAASYRDVAGFCLSEPNCKALLLWGFTDKHSWIPSVYSTEGDALIFDADYKPKPAYLSLKEALQAATGVTPLITGASVTGEQLVVTGENFGRGASVVIDWKRQKAENDKQSPNTSLVVKKAAKGVTRGREVRLQVRNSDGKLSPEFSYVFQ